CQPQCTPSDRWHAQDARRVWLARRSRWLHDAVAAIAVCLAFPHWRDRDGASSAAALLAGEPRCSARPAPSSGAIWSAARPRARVVGAAARHLINGTSYRAMGFSRCTLLCPGRGADRKAGPIEPALPEPVASAPRRPLVQGAGDGLTAPAAALLDL